MSETAEIIELQRIADLPIEPPYCIGATLEKARKEVREYQAHYPKAKEGKAYHVKDYGYCVEVIYGIRE